MSLRMTPTTRPGEGAPVRHERYGEGVTIRVEREHGKTWVIAQFPGQPMATRHLLGDVTVVAR